MTINFQEPAAILKPFIRKYLVIESGDGAENKILPDTALVMAFRYKGEVNQLVNGSKNTLPLSVLSGLRKSARIINYSKDAGTILVIFNEAAATAFFNVPMHELYDDTVALENFISKQKLTAIEDQLAEAKTTTERIFLIEQFLLTQLQNHATDRLILTAIKKIEMSNGYYKIKLLADDLFISQDAFEKRFRKATGASPKQFSSIIRMRSVIVAGKSTQNFTELAYSAGYFDQPHFNKEFKLFTGQTPTAFFRSPIYW
ncbi:helix-turn-helix domain-containing protein [Mucilaginibacter sp. X5P1]|uniref:helix-turn-helix domain-containing protein n=1 Tax=Mucilaginibacter sp. X5P1 TaxID=2723088 RepID=UPI00160AA798|nr:helix-turn-helix domain-containing protein [Mucilaginibacter sp. X5P1]MBB6139995.1 AraC-like DNA-binding protein [Mucilaginibacter sp. X5P1]